MLLIANHRAVAMPISECNDIRLKACFEVHPGPTLQRFWFIKGKENMTSKNRLPPEIS